MSITRRVRIEDSAILSKGWALLRKITFSFHRRDGTWQRQSREIYDRGDGATLLPYDPVRRTVLLVRQFRLPVFVAGCDELLLEAPAGMLDRAAPAVQIRAELLEETGYQVDEVKPIFEAFMSPGALTEKIHFFVARYSPGDRVAPGGGLAEEGEDIEVVELPFDEAMAMIDSGAIKDAKTIMMLMYAAINIFR